MSRKRRLTKEKLSRKAAHKPLKTKFFVFSEGAVTEPLYLRSIARCFSEATISIVQTGGAPRSLLEWATNYVDQKKSPVSESDQVWIIFDRDEHPHVAEVLAQHGAGKASIAYSNPCFELWLIYHFSECNGPLSRDEAKRKLAGLTDSYCSKKKKLLSAECFVPLLSEARKRSRKSVADRAAEGAALGCPCSTMFELVDALESTNPPTSSSTG